MTTSATESSVYITIGIHITRVALPECVNAGRRDNIVVAADLRCREPGIERRCVMSLAPSDSKVGRGRSLPTPIRRAHTAQGRSVWPKPLRDDGERRARIMHTSYIGRVTQVGSLPLRSLRHSPRADALG